MRLLSSQKGRQAIWQQASFPFSTARIYGSGFLWYSTHGRNYLFMRGSFVQKFLKFHNINETIIIWNPWHFTWLTWNLERENDETFSSRLVHDTYVENAFFLVKIFFNKHVTSLNSGINILTSSRKTTRKKKANYERDFLSSNEWCVPKDDINRPSCAREICVRKKQNKRETSLTSKDNLEDFYGLFYRIKKKT